MFGRTVCANARTYGTAGAAGGQPPVATQTQRTQPIPFGTPFAQGSSAARWRTCAILISLAFCSAWPATLAGMALD